MKDLGRERQTLPIRRPDPSASPQDDSGPYSARISPRAHYSSDQAPGTTDAPIPPGERSLRTERKTERLKGIATVVAACALIESLPATVPAKVIRVRDDAAAATSSGSSQTGPGMETFHTPAFLSPQWMARTVSPTAREPPRSETFAPGARCLSYAAARVSPAQRSSQKKVARAACCCQQRTINE